MTCTTSYLLGSDSKREHSRQYHGSENLNFFTKQPTKCCHNIMESQKGNKQHIRLKTKGHSETKSWEMHTGERVREKREGRLSLLRDNASNQSFYALSCIRLCGNHWPRLLCICTALENEYHGGHRDSNMQNDKLVMTTHLCHFSQ